MNNNEIYIKLEKAVGDNNVQEVSNILDQHSDLSIIFKSRKYVSEIYK